MRLILLFYICLNGFFVISAIYKLDPQIDRDHGQIEEIGHQPIAGVAGDKFGRDAGDIPRDDEQDEPQAHGAGGFGLDILHN